MVPYYGDFPEDATVYIPINTFDSNDPAASVTVTNLLNTDVHIHKNGGTTQRNNAAGITMTINYDSITGNHLLIIDTSDETVGGFWVAGAEYQVRVEGITVDAGTINAWVGAFSIERAGGTIALLKLIQAAVITNAAGVDIAADIIALKAETALIVADTNELQSDDYPTSIAAVKSDTAAILVDTGTTLQAELDAIEAAVITNAAGTDIAADIIALKAVADAVLVDTGTTLQGELDAIEAAVITNAAGVDIAADIIALKAVADAVLVDTGTTLQGELDAIEAAVITNAAGVDIAADIIALKAVADAVLVDTGTTLDGIVDDILVDTAELGAAVGVSLSADIAAIKAETALIVADTNELQSDDYPTSIAAIQTVVDAILVDTGTDGVAVAAASKTGYKLASDGADLVACDVATVGAAPTTLINKVQAIWNRLFNKKTVTEALETAYEKDDTTTMETWTLADDDTTASRTK